MQPEYYPPQTRDADMVLHGDVPMRKGVLDRPNESMMTDKDLLEIVKYYGSVEGAKKDDTELIVAMHKYFRVGFLDKQAVLTFQDRRDRDLLDIDFELNWLTFLMKLPPKQLTQEARLYKQLLKRKAYNIFHRSVGTDSGRTNERTLEATSVVQNISTPSGGGVPMRRGGGFVQNFGRLFK